MQQISLEDALLIAEKIDNGHMDHTTRDPRFAPLVKQPFLAESFLNLLRSLETGVNADFHQHNFVNVCRIMCPEFVSIISHIEIPELDIDPPSHHMGFPEPDTLATCD